MVDALPMRAAQAQHVATPKGTSTLSGQLDDPTNTSTVTQRGLPGIKNAPGQPVGRLAHATNLTLFWPSASV